MTIAISAEKKKSDTVQHDFMIESHKRGLEETNIHRQ